MSLGVEHQEIPNAAIIRLRGKLLLGEQCAPLDALVPELLKKGHRNLIFDLSGVTHIDSTGIGTFIDTYGRLGRVGGQIRLAAATGQVRDSFRVTRLDTVLPFYSTVESACESLR